MKLLVASIIIATVSAQHSAYNPRDPDDYRPAPYAYAGWRPSGPPFLLPGRQQVPRPSYGPPPQTFVNPQQEYGPPQSPQTPQPDIATTTELQEATTTTETPPATTTETDQPESEQINLNDESSKTGSDKIVENAGATQQGVYYIYHPSGLLQRVVYSTSDDVANMAYTARLKYENVEPIRAPVFTYDPQTLAFRQLEF